MFATQVAGQRPACIDDYEKRTCRAVARAKADVPSQPSWDGAYIRKLFAYFCEDGDGAELADKWKEGVPNSKEVKMALDTLLDIGINDQAKQNSAAETIVELISRRCVDWSILDESLTSTIEGLEEMKIDL